MRTITLTTDFGDRDGFAGVINGVLACRSPKASVIDIAHGIPRGDVRAAAFVLMAAFRYFPAGSVHVVVVDPGVGTRRAAVAVQAKGHFFVGPDNGVLCWATGSSVDGIVELTNSRYHLTPVSRTFHGRDIFAPVAAALATGTSLARLGRPRRSLVRLPFPRLDVRGGGAAACLSGEVLFVDGFGNAITNVTEAACRTKFGGRPVVVRAAGRGIPVVDAYGSVAPGSPLAVFASMGYLEIGVRDGRACDYLGLKMGSRVSVRRR